MKNIKNKPASQADRLRILAKQNGVNYEVVLVNYMLERFLYRLSVSVYVDNFVLKGGMLLFGLERFQTRPTRDIDFLARQIKNDVDTMKKIISEIVIIEINDGLVFDLSSLKITAIVERGEYGGIKAEMLCYLGRSRNTLIIDIGFGDAVIPSSRRMEFPVLLETEDVPVISVYSLESVIAEKFEAMVRFLDSNGRMKDFFDIVTISTKNNFDGRVLQEAVKETLSRRGTPYEHKLSIWEEDFSRRKQVEWTAFRNRIQGQAPESFKEVVDELRIFLQPIFQAICKEDEFFLKWNALKKAWEKVT